MFCTVTFEESKKRFSRNLIIENKKIGNIEFVKAVIHKPNAIKRLEKRLKNKVDTVILSDNIKDVEFKNIKIYNNSNFLKSIAKYSFLNVINISKIPTNKLSVCIKDKNLQIEDFIYNLAKKCSVIKIVTENIELAEKISDDIYNEFGMHIIITNEQNNVDLGLDLDENKPKIWFNTVKNSFIINENCVKIGVGLKKFVPNGISECDFAGVLQKYNDFKRLKLLHADRMFRENKLYKINEYNIKNFLDIKDNC